MATVSQFVTPTGFNSSGILGPVGVIGTYSTPVAIPGAGVALIGQVAVTYNLATTGGTATIEVFVGSARIYAKSITGTANASGNDPVSLPVTTAFGVNMTVILTLTGLIGANSVTVNYAGSAYTYST